MAGGQCPTKSQVSNVTQNWSQDWRQFLLVKDTPYFGAMYHWPVYTSSGNASSGLFASLMGFEKN